MYTRIELIIFLKRNKSVREESKEKHFISLIIINMKQIIIKLIFESLMFFLLTCYI